MSTTSSFKNYLPQLTLLAVCNALSISGQSMLITAGAIMGAKYATIPGVATLPVASQLLGVVLSMKLIANLIDRYGMKRSFDIGVLLGLVGGFALAISIYIGNFWLICLSLALTGSQVATTSYYRFAAADIVPVEFKPRAVSIVIFGAIAAAFIGPTLSVYGRYFSTQHEFLGIGLCYAALMAVQLIVLLFTRIEPIENESVDSGDVDIKRLFQDKRFQIGMLTTTVSFAVMTLIMNATPLEMDMHHLEYRDTAKVISWHVVGMFLPSLFSGFIIERFGYRAVLTWGSIILFSCNIALLNGVSFHNFLIGNILLGIGWNFLLVGGTALLAQVYSAKERSRVQYINNLTVYLTNFFAAAIAGGMHSFVGWQTMNICSLIVIILTFITIRLKLRIQSG